MANFKLRLNYIDHYQTWPTRFEPEIAAFARTSKNGRPPIPIIRVFGKTETGQKVCAHIHGFFPYLYIEYKGSLIPDEVASYISRIHQLIDNAMNADARSKRPIKFVAHISLVKGIPFFGFHVGYQFFLKIYLLDPRKITRCADSLRNASVMSAVFLPYESHMQYVPQFMCDYNLFGCDFLDAKAVSFRAPVPEGSAAGMQKHKWHDQSIPKEMVVGEMEIQKHSYSDLEVDICVWNILNRQSIEERRLHHDFTERSDPFPKDLKLVYSMAGLWRDEAKRRSASRASRAGESPFPAEATVSMSAEDRESKGGDWLHERELRDRIDQIVLTEKQRGEGRDMTFENYVTKNPFESLVQTVAQSIMELYPGHRPAGELSEKINLHLSHLAADFDWDDVDFDEEKLSQAYDLAGSQKPQLAEGDESDEEKAREKAMSQRPRGVFGPDGTPKRGSPWTPKQSTRTAQPQLSTLNLGAKPVKRVLFKDTDVTAMSPAEMKDIGVVEFRESQSTPEFPDFESSGPDSSDEHAVTDVPVDELGQSSPSTPRTLKRQGEMISSGPSKKMRTSNPAENHASTNSSIPHIPSSPPLGGQGGMWKHFSPASKHHATTPSRLRTFVKVDSPDRPTTVQPKVLPRAKGSTSMALADSSTGKLKFNADQLLPNSLHHDGDEETIFGSSFDAAEVALMAPDPAFIEEIERRPPLSSNRLKTSSSQILGGSTSPAQATSDVTELEPPWTHDGAFDTTNQWADNIADCFQKPGTAYVMVPVKPPPTTEEAIAGLKEEELDEVEYQEVYYSNPKDIPKNPFEYAGKSHKLKSKALKYLPEFNPFGGSSAQGADQYAAAKAAAAPKYRPAPKTTTWEIAEPPPTAREVKEEEAAMLGKKPGEAEEVKLERRPLVVASYPLMISQLHVPTQKAKTPLKQKDSSIITQETGYMSIMSMECFACNRGKLIPHPSRDEISAIMWCFEGATETFPLNGYRERTYVGIIIKKNEDMNTAGLARSLGFVIEEEETELDMMNRFVDIVRICDPDIITGYEIHTKSWGYLVERGAVVYELNFLESFSRAKSNSNSEYGKAANRWGYNTTTAILVTGRHVINIWRVMRGDLNLLHYTFENVAYHLLQRRVPHYHPSDLTEWYCSRMYKLQERTIRFFTERVQMNLEILDEHEFVPRTSEQARLLGVDWFAVSARGSQFKVESIMFRIGKPESLMMPSPSRRQVGGQNALECLPLVMEPQSDFYTSPMLVLDFQSLYPSVMIAYNLCYSTFLGRITEWRGMNKMGFTDYRREPRLLELLQDHITVTPNGMMYVKPSIRRSLLAKMLSEILETRIMVKTGMKMDKDNRPLQSLLNNRQLALKLLANVTYGYTSASFSGRMPCVEIADSIVQTGRETLEKAIALIHSVKRWDAEVVYGDTDSLFVHLKGRSKDAAFEIGNEIAEAVTKANPKPIKLKFEKVYLPCVLLAKKRYVGFKYEHKDQKEPDWDAKGIETVRRDGTPGQQKILETCTKILFRTSDLSQVKKHFQAECTKLDSGKISIQDFLFAKEVKLGTYADGHLPPPGAMIATKRMQLDPMLEPHHGERVPYVVVTGAPGARLIDKCVDPEVLLTDPQKELDKEYYIQKTWIPTLERIFNLVGGNVQQWYNEMPKKKRLRKVEIAYEDEHGIRERQRAGNGNLTRGIFGMVKPQKHTLENYMRTASCLVCDERFTPPPTIGPKARARAADPKKAPLEVVSNLCHSCRKPVRYEPPVEGKWRKPPPFHHAQRSLLVLRERLDKDERRAEGIRAVCRGCGGLDPQEDGDVRCDSKDCPVFYSRVRAETKIRNEGRGLRRVIAGLERVVSGNDW